MKKIRPCLLFDSQAEEAAEFYVSVFKNSRIIDKFYYPPGTGAKEGKMMLVSFELNGQEFTALNGGPEVTFNEAISLEAHCEGQAEIDEIWEKLTADGGQEIQCGWLKDKFGVAWQVMPHDINEIMGFSDPEKAARTMQVMFGMKKLDIETLKNA